MSIRCDYKHAATVRQRRRQTTRRHGLLVITLILIGLFGGLLAYIRGDKTPPPPVASSAAPSVEKGMSTPSPAPTTTPTPPATTPKTSAHNKKTSAAVEAVIPPPITAKYAFYTELPKRQIEINRPHVMALPAKEVAQKIAPRRQPAPATKPMTKTVITALNTGNAARLFAGKPIVAPLKTALSTPSEPKITKIAARSP